MCITPRIHPGLSPGGFLFFFNLNSLLSETGLYIGGLENKNFRADLSYNLGQHWQISGFLTFRLFGFVLGLVNMELLVMKTGHWSLMAKIRGLISAAKTVPTSMYVCT